MKKFLALALFALVATAATTQSFWFGGYGFGGGCATCGYSYAPVYYGGCC